MDAKTALTLEINKAIAKAFSEEFATVSEEMLESPPDKSMGDFAFPCFRLSKPLKMPPVKIAEALMNAFSGEKIAKAQQMGPYLNFFLDRESFARDIIEGVIASEGKWGASESGKGKTVCLDYSSINIAKRFHIGHLSTTVIGAALARIYEFQGWKAVRINHLGDWGTQFGKMIAAYKHWGSKEQIEKGGVQALSDLYVRFHKEAENNPALEDEGRLWFKKIEDGDEEALEIFNNFKELTLKDAAKVYELLNVDFDSYAGESFYNDKMQPVIDELRAKNLLEESDGAFVVKLDGENDKPKLPPCLILKSDGASLYATRDLAAALYRKQTYNFDKCLYVVAYQQDLHFKQLFRVLKKMGYAFADNMEHVAFGMVSYEGEALSTRKGNIIYLEDLLRRSQEKALKIIEEKSPNMENKELAARQIGIGSVIFSVLFNNRIKDIDFWWDRALSFDGETAPYVQYTATRCLSVLQKGKDIAAEPDYFCLSSDCSQQLLLSINAFKEAVVDALERNEPYLVTRAIVQIAKNYNKFYYEERIISDNASETKARLLLSRATREVILTGLKLLGIEAPDKM